MCSDTCDTRHGSDLMAMETVTVKLAGLHLDIILTSEQGLGVKGRCCSGLPLESRPDNTSDIPNAWALSDDLLM